MNTLIPELLDAALGTPESSVVADATDLTVFKRDGSGDVLVTSVADVNGVFNDAQWDTYSGEVIAAYYYDENGGTKHPPRAIVTMPVAVPYVAPLFTTFFNGSSVNGTIVTVTGGGSYGAKADARTDPVLETKTDKKYLWFVSSLFDIVGINAWTGICETNFTYSLASQDHVWMSPIGSSPEYVMGGSRTFPPNVGITNSDYWFYFDFDLRTFDIYKDGEEIPTMSGSWSEAEKSNLGDLMPVYMGGEGTYSSDVLFDSSDWLSSPPSAIPLGWVRVGE